MSSALTDSAGVARRWGVLHRFVVGTADDTYLDRLSLVTTPWFSIKLHRIYRPDRQRDLHDHPWSFLSIPVCGNYVEVVPDPQDERALRGRWISFLRWNWKRAEDAHSILSVSRSPVWTLVVTGPRRRVWGFLTARGWIKFDEYEGLNDA